MRERTSISIHHKDWPAEPSTAKHRAHAKRYGLTRMLEGKIESDDGKKTMTCGLLLPAKDEHPKNSLIFTRCSTLRLLAKRWGLRIAILADKPKPRRRKGETPY